MPIEQYEIQRLGHLELLARQVVEGFITGLHKSPFHGFSVEFAEHRLYNTGESTRYIDWKLFGRSDKLFVKRFEEETNLRCQLIIDNSSSMHFPEEGKSKPLNKIAGSAVDDRVLDERVARDLEEARIREQEELAARRLIAVALLAVLRVERLAARRITGGDRR